MLEFIAYLPLFTNTNNTKLVHKNIPFTAMEIEMVEEMNGLCDPSPLCQALYLFTCRQENRACTNIYSSNIST